MSTNNSVNVGLAGATGTGNFVGATSPTLVTPALGTPSSGNLSSCTGYATGSLSGLGTGVATALAANVTGSGGIALATSPNFTTPVLGTPTSGNLSNCTAYPGAWINRQVLLSGTTYTPTSGTKRIFGRMLGGGGGSAGNGTGSPTNGGNGGSTTFASSAYIATGGGGSATNGAPGAPGANCTIVSASTDFSSTGAPGTFGALLNTGGTGGSTFMGGAGQVALGAGNAQPGATNTGGAASGCGPNGANNGGSGGAAGSYVEFWKGSISGTYTYAIGAGGTAGNAGTGGIAGAIGGSGIIIIDEYS